MLGLEVGFRLHRLIDLETTPPDHIRLVHLPGDGTDLPQQGLSDRDR